MSSLSERAVKQKAAIYIRVSTHWQVDKDSLQVQKRDLIAYCSVVLNIDEYEIFEDPGYSAKNTDRPAYQSMMSRLRSGEFSHLLVWKIDRISRNLLDFTAMYKELKDLGITFVSKNEQFDTSSAIGEAMLKIILVFAELERQMTAERVSAVMLSRANEGKWNGGRIPYGYRYDKATKEFSVDPQEAKIVVKIHEMYEQYQSVLYVSRSLNEQNIKTKTGKNWSTTTVYKILTNVFYIGLYRYNVHREGSGYIRKDESEWITIDNHHEPIVDRDLFERNNFILSRNKRGGVAEGTTYVRKNIHVFGGLLRCGICGSNMSATLDRRRADGWRPSIYACNMRRNDSKRCGNKYISDIMVGPFVFNYIANIIRAKETTTISTSLEALERKLLRGNEFAGIDHINTDGLEALWSVLTSQDNGTEYSPAAIFTQEADVESLELDNLHDQKRKCETAIDRLRSLYLFDKEHTPESEYIIEREKLMKQLNTIDSRIKELEAKRVDSKFDGDFMSKASYFVMTHNLLEGRRVDYEKFIRYIDPSVPKAFLKSIINRIIITEGKVTEIRFKNGITHKFTYKR